MQRGAICFVEPMDLKSRRGSAELRFSCFPDSLSGPCFHQNQRDSGMAASSAISDRAWAGWRSVDGPVIVFPMRDRVGAVERRRCETGSREKSKILGATVWRMEPPGYRSVGDETVV